jgi:DNA-binding Lrp family transcriptional regulator
MKMLNPTNAKILEGLSKYGPRNISSLAKSIGLPSTTVAFRIKKLIKEGSLKIGAKLDYSKLGLMRAVIIAETILGFEERLRRLMENLGYWTYITKCYGRFNGFYNILAFPVERKKELQAYLKEAANLKALSRHVLFWVTNFCEVAPNFDWFNFEKKEWRFPWQQWIDELLHASQIPSQGLMNPKTYSINVDETDLLILKELEKNGTAEFTQLAKVVDATPQSVRYRYYKHVVRRNLIAGYEVSIFPYPIQVSDMCSFIIDFESKEKLAQFSNTLQDKPFVLSYAKVLRQNSLIVHTYTPKLEFPNLIDSLSSLTRKNIVTNFLYITLDISSYKRQTVSYEFFKDNAWAYNQKERLEKLRKI